jgi:hypothetical protein
MDNKKIFVPYGLNFKTSFLFLLPLFYSYYNNLLDITLGCNICLITSLLNHATYNKIINKIDKITNSICLIYFTIYYYTNNIYYYLMICCLCIVVYTIKISKLSYHLQYGIYIHSLIHLIGNIGILLLIKSK